MKALVALLASAAFALGANPYLHLPDDKPVVRKFNGEKWAGEEERHHKFTVEVTTVRLKKMTWGEIYRIEVDSTSVVRESLYLLVTEGKISKMEPGVYDINELVRRIGALKKPPQFQGETLAIASGTVRDDLGDDSGVEIKSSNGTCTFTEWWHHGGKRSLVWKKAEGIVEIGEVNGIHSGYRLTLQKKK